MRKDYVHSCNFVDINDWISCKVNKFDRAFNLQYCSLLLSVLSHSSMRLLKTVSMISIKSVKTIETKPTFCHIRKKEVKVKTHRNSNVVVQLPLQVSPI